MPDYIYLLESRLSADQRHALRQLRDVAAEAGTILFLTGGAVRELTSGHAVRELEVSVHGDVFKLKKAIVKTGGMIWGEDEPSKTLYLCFPGTVRVDLISTHSVEYPKPGKPVYHLASIQEDLRRRDFTANAMAISLNEGSFGLLMDPLNGAADIEQRTLRLVSNYGFLEEPAILVRATRYRARLGWDFDARTQSRYENAKAEGVIQFLSAHARAEELEQIGHEEEGLKVLQALDAEGWMKVLCPSWTPDRADSEGLKTLHDVAVELLLQGVHSEISAAQMELLTAKMAPKDLAALKKQLLRPGFVEEWNSLGARAAGFAKALTAKTNQVPSAMFRLFMSYDPEAVLWLLFTTKDAGVRERYNLFLKVWPEKRQQIPHALMQEMRITPELPSYGQIVESVFLELIDGRLTTPEEMRAFLEPHSPPAPPPQMTIKRTRARRGAEPKLKAAFDDESEDGMEEEELDGMGGDEDDDEAGIGSAMPKGDLGGDSIDEGEREAEEDQDEEEGGEEEEPAPVAAKRGGKSGRSQKPVREPSSPGAASTGNVAPAAQAAARAENSPAAKVSAPQKTVSKVAAAQPAVPPLPVAKGKPTPEAAKGKPAAEPPKAKPAASVKPAPAPAKATKPPAANPGKKQPPAKPAAKPPAKAVPKPASSAKANAKAPAKGQSAKSVPARAKSAAGKSAKTHKTAKPRAKKAAAKSVKKR